MRVAQIPAYKEIAFFHHLFLKRLTGICRRSKVNTIFFERSFLMNRFAVEYSYTEINAMHIMNVYGLNCVCKYLNC